MGESVPEKNFLLMRREPDRSIFQAVLSKKHFFHKSRILGSGNLAECQRGPKVTLLLLPASPPSPRRFLQGGPGARNPAERARTRPRARGPRTEASSSILSCWQRRAPNELRPQNWSPEVIRGSLSSLTERIGQASDQKGGLGLDFSRQDFSQRRGATFGPPPSTLRDLRVRECAI